MNHGVFSGEYNLPGSSGFNLHLFLKKIEFNFAKKKKEIVKKIAVCHSLFLKPELLNDQYQSVQRKVGGDKQTTKILDFVCCWWRVARGC